MKKYKCDKCKSDNVLVTMDGEGEMFAKTCLDCGYEYESKKFKDIMKKFNDPEFDIDYSVFANKK